MRGRGLSIGVLAARSGTNAPTIRYYEDVGLLRRPDRREGGHRVYDEADVRRLTFIRRCRAFGFPVERVKALVALVQDADRSCLEARDLAQEHLTAVRAKLRELKELERGLTRFVRQCESECIGGPGPDCTILEDLSLPATDGRAKQDAR